MRPSLKMGAVLTVTLMTFALLARVGFAADDTSAVKTTGSRSEIDIQFVMDGDPTTGDPYEVVVLTTGGNPDDVILDLRVGSGEPGNYIMTKEENGLWTYHVDIPFKASGFLFLEAKARVAGERIDTTGPVNLEIVDDEPPRITCSSIPETAAAGERFELDAQIEDNVEAVEAWLLYSLDGGEMKNSSMTKVRGPLWSSSIDIPGEARGDLRITGYAMDEYGNINSTEPIKTSIIDEASPVIDLMDILPDPAISGKKVTFLARITDNWEVERAFLSHNETGIPENDLSMDHSEDLYSCDVDIPSYVSGNVDFSITAFDSSGNTVITDPITVEVVDRTRPWIDPIEDMDLLVGDSVSIEAEAGDNVGIRKIVWFGGTINHTGRVLDLNLTETRSDIIEVTVFDTSGNTVSRSFHLNVYPVGYDSDGDGIPDQFERESGLNPLDPADGETDRDMDQFTNLQEYLYGTDPNDIDSDEDGMPDGWEVKYGLDPLRYSAEEDTDRDGISDLDEYIKGSDPTLADDDSGILPWVVAVGAIMTVMILIAAAVIYSKTRKREKIDIALKSKGPSDRYQLGSDEVVISPMRPYSELTDLYDELFE